MGVQNLSRGHAQVGLVIVGNRGDEGPSKPHITAAMGATLYLGAVRRLRAGEEIKDGLVLSVGIFHMREAFGPKRHELTNVSMSPISSPLVP